MTAQDNQSLVRIYGEVTLAERNRAYHIIPHGLGMKVMGRVYVRTLDLCSIDPGLIGHIIADNFRLSVTVPHPITEALEEQANE